MGLGKRQGCRYVCAGGADARPKMIHLKKMVHYRSCTPQKKSWQRPWRKDNITLRRNSFFTETLEPCMHYTFKCYYGSGLWRWKLWKIRIRKIELDRRPSHKTRTSIWVRRKRTRVEDLWCHCHCVMDCVSNAQITIKSGDCEDNQNGEARGVQHSMPRNKLMWSFHATFNWHHLKNCGKCSCSKRGNYYPNKNWQQHKFNKYGPH